jgi:hypothetical protein
MSLESIYGSVTLRPTRIGFLVRPTQQNISQVREIIRMCTCLWGGMFNPIIPVCTTLPASWRQDRFKGITGKGLADAYIRFFEPDVFVEAEAGLSKEVGITTSRRFLSERVRSLKQLVGSDGRRQADFVFGLSTLDIYRELYQKEFKFVSRKKRKVALFADDDPYCEAVFGAFSHSRSLAYMKKAYVDICEPDSFSASAANCLRLFKEGYFTPLQATLHELDVTFKNRDDPTIFIFDPHKTVDLIDYWNLRQFRSSLLPINVHWFDQFAETIRKMVTANFRSLPGNKHGVMVHTTIEFARSIDPAKRDALLNAYMAGLPAGSFISKHWYDPIWRTEWRTAGIQPRRAKLTSFEVDIEETVDQKNTTLTFPSPAPKFASEYSFANNDARWVNVVKLTDFVSRDSYFALTFPPNIKDGDFPALGYVSESFCTREGIVLFQQYKSHRASLLLMSQQDAVIGRFASRGIEAKPSSSGRNATQVLRAAGGTDGCSLFADEGTVKLLDKMAKTIHREADGATAQYPDRTASIAEWKEVLGRRSKAIFSSAKLSDFTDRNVMRVGLSLSCPHCAKENWYSLSDVNYEVTCERCLNRFSFPQAGIKFNESDWRFRVSGPFSVPDYADGAYATVLTLRLFNNTLNFSRTPTTFATGLDIVSGASKFEIDFAGWYTEGKKFWIDPSPVVVFGEAKSFGAEVFKERDVRRLKDLAETFPGSYVVFSAMKTQLADIERSRIRKFAEWGRVPQKNGEPRAMVIVLTGIELFADRYLKDTWEKLGGHHAAMVKHASVHLDDLWTLAEITQRLYLGMSSYWDWRALRLRKRKGKAPA